MRRAPRYSGFERLEERRALAVTATLLHDFTPGEASSVIRNARSGSDGYYYLHLDEGALWRTDGTPEGTSLLDSQAVSSFNSTPARLFGDHSVFTAYSNGPNTGEHVWITDGTEGGTRVFIPDHTLVQSPHVSADGATYLVTHRTTGDRDEHSIWTYDGATEPVRLMEFNDGWTTRFHIRDIGGITYFAEIESHWNGMLLRTDGTPEGTWQVSDAIYGNLQQNNQGWHYLEGDELRSSLFRINGQTGEPERLLTDLTPTFRGAHWLHAFGEHFAIIHEVNGEDGLVEQLCISDGTEAGTHCDVQGDVEVEDFYRHQIRELGDAIILPSSAGVWRSDGTADGTYLLGDGMRFQGQIGDFAYLVSDVPAHVKETITHYTDGTSVFELSTGTPNADVAPRQLSAAGVPVPEAAPLPWTTWQFEEDFVYRGCSDQSYCGPSQLWETTESGQLTPIWVGDGHPVRAGDTWFRVINDGSTQRLANTNGQAIVEPLGWPGERYRGLYPQVPDLPLAYFTTSTDAVSNLWSINADAEVSWVDQVVHSPHFYAGSEVMIYTRPDGEHGTELRAFDVRTSQTQPIEFPEMPTGARPTLTRFRNWDGAHLFEIYTEATGTELWAIDGSFDPAPAADTIVIPVTDVRSDDGPIALQADWSRDVDGTATYSWDLNNDGVFGDVVGRSPQLIWQDVAKLQPAPLKDQYNPVRVRAVDSNGNSSEGSGMMRVLNTAPTLRAVTTESDSVVGEPVAIFVDAVDATDDPLTYEIDFGDGTVRQSQSPEILHTYDRMGQFRVTITVSDPHGGTVSAERSIRVDQPDPQLRWHFTPGKVFGSGSSTVDIDLRDWNDDGRWDQIVATVDDDYNQLWRLVDGVPTAEPQIMKSDWSSVQATHAAVVMPRGPGMVHVGDVGTLQNGGVGWTNHMRTGLVRVDVAAADLNGDNKTDLFIANRTQQDGGPAGDSVVLHEPDQQDSGAWHEGKFIFQESQVTPYHSESVELGDLNGDGTIDAVTAGLAPETAHVWLNDGSANFTESEQTLAVSGEHIAVGDLDGDGALDLFALTGAGNQVWINDGRGHFTDSQQRLGDAPSSHVALGDLDGDGDLDAVVTNRAGHATRLWLNDGAGNFVDSGARLAPQLDSERVALGDVDFDGDLDVLVANGTSGNQIFLNSFTAADTTPPSLLDVRYIPGDSTVTVEFEFSKPVVIETMVVDGQQISHRDLTWNDARSVYRWKTTRAVPSSFSLAAEDGRHQPLAGEAPDRIFQQFAGDLDNDLTVTDADFAILASNFGRAGTAESGDLTGDGIVNFEDFLILAANYKKFQ